MKFLQPRIKRVWYPGRNNCSSLLSTPPTHTLDATPMECQSSETIKLSETSPYGKFYHPIRRARVSFENFEKEILIRVWRYCKSLWTELLARLTREGEKIGNYKNSWRGGLETLAFARHAVCSYSTAFLIPNIPLSSWYRTRNPKERKKERKKKETRSDLKTGIIEITWKKKGSRGKYCRNSTNLTIHYFV